MISNLFFIEDPFTCYKILIVFKETNTAATIPNNLNSKFHLNNVLPKSDEDNLLNEEKTSEVNATIIDDKRDNVTSNVASESEKHMQNAKDIIDDSGDNLNRVYTSSTTTTPTIPTIRTTLPNTFSNAGGNGGKFDDVQMLTSDSMVHKRHRRRRQGRYLSEEPMFPYFTIEKKTHRKPTKKPKSKSHNYQERFEKLKHELNRPVITSDFFKQKHMNIESTQTKTKKYMEYDGNVKDWPVNDMPEEISPLSEIDSNIVSKKRSTVETALTELTTEIPTIESVSDSERYTK